MMTVSVNKYMAILAKLTTVMFLLILPGIPCQGQMNKVVEVGTGDELPQPYVYSLNQDKDGFLWIGTGAGLVRYDGIDFKLYTTFFLFQTISIPLKSCFL